MEAEKLTNKIKTIALSSGAELVGTASAEQLEEGSPKGHRPSDLILNAKSAPGVRAEVNGWGDQPVPDMVMSRLKELTSWMFNETESVITKLITWSGLMCCPSRFHVKLI